jgi:hypothetical protein
VRLCPHIVRRSASTAAVDGLASRASPADLLIFMKYACVCCGYLTLDEAPSNTFQFCPVCFWEDDDVQFGDPSFEGGANRVSLHDARANYAAFGAVDQPARAHVRPPLLDEVP